MMRSNTNQTVIFFGLFLVSLFFFPFDIAITLLLSLFFFFRSLSYRILILVASFLLIVDFLFQYYDISFRFISNLALDAYIFSLTAIFSYMRSQKIFLLFLDTMGRIRKDQPKKNIVLKLVISFSVSFLLFPLLGISVSLIIGYITFSYLVQEFQSRYAFLLALSFLLFCPLFIILKRDALSESFAIASYYFLLIGALQEILHTSFFRHAHAFPRHPLLKFSQKDTAARKKDRRHFAFRIPTYLPVHFSNRNARFSAAILSFSLSFGLLYFFLPDFPARVSRETFSGTPETSPSVSVHPPVDFTPVSPDMSRERILQLHVLVQNGTDVVGLAASTSARLTEAGFRTVAIGNAPSQNFDSWEISLTSANDAVVAFIQDVLHLSDLRLSDVSVPEGYDVLLVAGGNL